jgi:4-amino-4-deoxy-L-arabinose transferase-like glycosyltransferase
MDRHASAATVTDTDPPSPFPPSLLGWLPFLWSRVLFPGDGSIAATTWHGKSLVLLLALPAVLLYPCCAFPLFEPDESRYAEIAREMYQRGDVVVPYLQGEPYLDKPPLLYWLVALSYRLFGVHDGAARGVSAVAVHGTVLLVYLFGRRWFGEGAAFRGALALSLAPGFLGMGRLLLLDGLLTFWTTLALFSAFEAIRGERLRRGWWLMAALACGLGVLTKGPVALLLLAPPLWLHRRFAEPRAPLSRSALLAFFLVLAAVNVPWYAAICLREPAFAKEFVWDHHVRRFLAPFAHEHGVWYYGPVLFLGLLPGTLLAVPFVRFLVSGDRKAARQRTPQLGFLLLAGGWCVLFFTLSACKLPTYILPAFPPLALAFGDFLARGRWSKARSPVVGAGVSFVLLLLAHYVAIPWYAAYRSPVGRPEDVWRLCADRQMPVVCYPRNCDSIAFYLGRDDLRVFRSKDIEDLRRFLRSRPRAVILCTHRHSLRGLRQLLPPDVKVVEAVHFGLQDLPGVPPKLMKLLALLMGETALGLGDAAVVESNLARPGHEIYVEPAEDIDSGP